MINWGWFWQTATVNNGAYLAGILFAISYFAHLVGHHWFKR